MSTAATFLKRIPAKSANNCYAVAPARKFSTEPGIRRPKPLRLKKGEARRVIEPKRPTSIANIPDDRALSHSQPPFIQQPAQENQQTLKSVMKESFLWGVGMSIAFVFVGLIFSGLEQAEEAGQFDASQVICGDKGESAE